MHAGPHSLPHEACALCGVHVVVATRQYDRQDVSSLFLEFARQHDEASGCRHYVCVEGVCACVTSSLRAANWRSPHSQMDDVSPRGQSTQRTPICSISLVFIVLSSKKIISEKGTPLSALRRSKCFRFEPGKICCSLPVRESKVVPGAASNFVRS